MRRSLILLAAIACASVLGCDLITGVGNLTFVGDAGVPGNPSSSDGGGGADGDSDGGVLPSGPMPPSGTQLATSSTLSIYGITTDGYVAYVDTAASELYAVGVEEPDGGPSPSPSPTDLGGADLHTANVDGMLVEFFPTSSESQAGPSHVGALNVWSSSLGDPIVVASGALVPDITSGFFTIASSADGRFVAYFGPVDANGATAPLAVMDTVNGTTKELAPSVDVLEDVCEPKLAFSGAYLVAAYCAVPAGGAVDAGLPDGGTNGDIATVERFDPSTGASFRIASGVRASFGVDPNGVTAILFGASGLVTSPIAGASDGGLLAIDPAATSGLISNDGTTVYYATSASALKRARTTSPPDPVELVPSSFNYLDQVSNDGSWVIGGANLGTQADTGDLYLASAQQPGSAITLSSATTATVVQGNAFTADSKYALFFTGFGSDRTGALTAYALGATGSPVPLGTGTYWAQAATGSLVVFNVNTSGGKADLEWRNVANDASATLAVSQAGAYFVLGPALDEVVYTYSAGGGSDGLWVLKLGALCTGGGGGPIAYHPPSGGAGSCTADEFDSFDTNCVAMGSADLDCAETLSISATCLGCLVTPWSSAQWGVILDTNAGGGIDILNAGGCFAQQGDVACASAIEAQGECENSACSSQPDIDSFNSCTATADTATCACYVANAVSACAAVSSSECYPDSTQTFEEAFETIGPIMCE